MIITPMRTGTQTFDFIHDIQPLYPEGSMQEYVVNDMLETIQHLEERDRHHLEKEAQQEERIAELEEENNQLHAQRCPHCAGLEIEKQRLQEHLDRSQNQRTDQYLHYSRTFDWLQKILTNTTIPSGCKITYIYLYLLFTFMRHMIVDKEVQVPLSEIAQGTGQSTSAIHDHLKKAALHDLLTRRDVKEENKEGEPRTIVHLTLHSPILEPEHINLEKVQGGKRQKGCRIDGTPLDKWTVLHCPTHDEVTYYGQPGLRADATTTGLVDAIIRQHEQRIPHALAYKKQDAFEDESPSAKPEHHHETHHQPEVPAIECTDDQKHLAFATEHQAISPTSDPFPNDQSQKKQDAFEQTPIATQHLADKSKMLSQLDAQHSPSNSTASCSRDCISNKGKTSYPPIAPQVTYIPQKAVCHAQMPLNKEGEPASACNKHGHADKIMSYRECGSTRWIYSQQERGFICRECWTPVQPLTFK